MAFGVKLSLCYERFLFDLMSRDETMGPWIPSPEAQTYERGKGRQKGGNIKLCEYERGPSKGESLQV